METKTKSKNTIKPILLIEELPGTFGSGLYRNSKKRRSKISEEEKIMLTLIANIIVELALKEEL